LGEPAIRNLHWENQSQFLAAAMGRLMVFTFGWTGDFVVRCIVRMGVRQEDKFLVLRVKPRDELAEKRFQEAYRYVVEFLEKLGADYGIEYADVELEGDLRSTVARIARLVASKASRGVEEVYVFLVGGPRPLVVAALLASRLLAPILGVPLKLYTAMEDSRFSLGVHLD